MQNKRGTRKQIESDQLYQSRNSFSPDGAYETPATSAVGAALGGYLRDMGAWQKSFSMLQGRAWKIRLDCLYNRLIKNKGDGVKVSGEETRICFIMA